MLREGLSPFSPPLTEPLFLALHRKVNKSMKSATTRLHGRMLKRLTSIALRQALLNVYFSQALVPFSHGYFEAKEKVCKFNWTENEDILSRWDITLEKLFSSRYAKYSLLLSFHLQRSCYFACDLNRDRESLLAQTLNNFMQK